MTPELESRTGGSPTPDETAAIVAAAEAVLAASRSGETAPHPAYVSGWWAAGRDDGLRRFDG